MLRIMHVSDALNSKKYILKINYCGFGVYQEICPSGYYHSQSWLVFDGKIGFICDPYNHRCKEELLDCIDTYLSTGKFGLHGFLAKQTSTAIIYGVHPNVKDYSF